MHTGALLILTLAVASPFRPLPGGDAPATPHVRSGKSMPARSGLPHSYGKSFATLDAYLLHLQQHAAPVGLPWWKPVGADRFEKMTGRGAPQHAREFASRVELERKFGFANDAGQSPNRR